MGFSSWNTGNDPLNLHMRPALKNYDNWLKMSGAPPSQWIPFSRPVCMERAGGVGDRRDWEDVRGGGVGGEWLSEYRTHTVRYTMHITCASTSRSMIKRGRWITFTRADNQSARHLKERTVLRFRTQHLFLPYGRRYILEWHGLAWSVGHSAGSELSYTWLPS